MPDVLCVLLRPHPAHRASSATLYALDLTLASLEVSTPLLLALEGATRLSALSLSGTHLDDDFLPAIAACTSLHTLNLSSNPGVTAAGLSVTLPALTAQLQRLDLRGTGISNAVLPSLKHLPRLQQLVLADTAISWESKAGAVAAGAEAPAGVQPAQAAPVHAAVPLAQRGMPEGFPQAPGSVAGPPIVQCLDTRTPASGWAGLQLLDVSSSELTDASCRELATELAAAAAAGRHVGLRVLRIGSSACRLGRKALAAIGQLTSLEQLVLQVSFLPGPTQGVCIRV